MKTKCDYLYKITKELQTLKINPQMLIFKVLVLGNEEVEKHVDNLCQC